MATPEEIAALRGIINEPTQDPYTDQILSDRLDANDGNVRLTAAAIWGEKAGRYSELVDVQEGSSRRSLSALYQQALNMSNFYGGDSGSGSGSGRFARTRPIERQ